jgi:hypothetical protein
MEDLDKQLEGMKQNVMGLQVWNPDSTSYFQASGDDSYNYADGIDPYSYVDGIDPYSYGSGEGLAKLQGLFDKVGQFAKTNKETIQTVGGLAGGLASGNKGGECKGLFGGAMKRKLGLCQDAPEPVAYVAPKSNTGLYIGIGVGVLAIGIVTIILIRKK